ncbi:MAG: PilZ domain-containing protein [Methyloprofundus sp.]|nr:PilZ domain-containing protein [Methyloprofundus sp.]
MTDARKDYRQTTSMDGLLFLGGYEHKMSIHDLSISGLSATIEPSVGMNHTDDILAIMQKSDDVDLYIKKISLAGEAQIIRVDMQGKLIKLALKFKQMSYDADNLLYKRKAYRKGMTEPGKLLIGDGVYSFMTQNVSIDGLMVKISEHIKLKQGQVLKFKFTELLLFGDAVVMWFEHDQAGHTLLGLQYKHIQKGDVPDLPIFYDTE